MNTVMVVTYQEESGRRLEGHDCRCPTDGRPNSRAKVRKVRAVESESERVSEGSE